MKTLTENKRKRFAGAVAAFALVAAGALSSQVALGQTLSSPESTLQKVTPYIVANPGPGGNVTCAQLGYEKSSARANYNSGSGTFDRAFPTGINVTVKSGIYVDWTSTFGIGAVIVKGGNAANIYEYMPQKREDEGLASPPNASGGPAGLSNLTFCWNPEPEVDISIEKTLKTEGIIKPGDSVEFEITVTNTGNVDLEHVIVSDRKSPDCGETIGVLPAGESETYTCYATMPTVETHVFKDTFSAKSYHNNNGNAKWKGPWSEFDKRNTGGAPQDPKTGNVFVGSNSMLWMRNKPAQSPLPSIARSANLYGTSSARLSFDWITWCGVDPEDKVVVEISKNGAEPFTVLKWFSGKSCASKKPETFDIGNYISANTRIRFRIAQGYTHDNEMFKFDNVVVTAKKYPSDFVNKACVSGKYGEAMVNDCDTATVEFN